MDACEVANFLASELFMQQVDNGCNDEIHIFYITTNTNFIFVRLLKYITLTPNSKFKIHFFYLLLFDI